MTPRRFESIPDVARRGARRFGWVPALQDAAGGSLTYDELWKHARSGATRLSGSGLAPATPVILSAAPGPDWAVALFAILAARLVAVPLVAGLPVAAVRALAQKARVGAIVADEARLALADALPGALRFPIAEVANARPSPRAPRHGRAEDLALLCFTSGSTAAPRAVELTHANVLADIEALLAARSAARGDALLSMLPPAHLFELVCGLLAPLACGARVVYPGTLLPNRIVTALRERRITHALAVPALLAAIFAEILDALGEARAAGPGRSRASAAGLAAWLRNEARPVEVAALRAAVRERLGDTLRRVTVGGAALDRAWGDVLAAIGVQLDVGYGLTEAGPVVSVGAAGECPPGSVGRPLPGVRVRISVDGEILVAGRNVMRGYLGDPAASAAALRGGWLHTGDHGRFDAKGFLFVTGRIKEAIVPATGETVWPDEVEPHYASPLFAEWCVVPVRAADGNDEAMLVVVPARHETTDEEIAAAFRRLRAAAPPRCRVASLHRVAGPLPRTATGKVRRRALVEALRAGGAP